MSFIDKLKKAGSTVSKGLGAGTTVSKGLGQAVEKQTNFWDNALTDAYTTLASAYGGALASKEIKKSQAEASRQQQLLGDAVNQQIKNPNIPQDKKIRLLKMYQDTNPDIISAVPELQITDKEVWGASARVALDMLTLGNPLKYGATPKAVLGNSFKLATKESIYNFDKVYKLGRGLSNIATVNKYGERLGQAINVAKKYGTQMGYDALFGGAYGVADAAGRNMSIEDMKKNGYIGAGVNAIAPVMFGLTLRGLNYGLKTTGRGIQSMSTKLRDAAETYYLGTTPEQRAIAAKNVVNEALAIYEPIEKTTKQNIAKGVVNVIDWVDDLPRKLFDSGIKIKDVSRQAYNEFRTGRDAATFKADQKKFELINDILPKDIEVRKSTLAKLRWLDDLDRVRLGNKLPGDLTEEQINNKLIQLNTELVDSGKAELVQQSIDKYNNFNKQLLQELIDNGRISSEVADNLITSHPNYIPHEHVANIIDNASNSYVSVSKNPYQSAIQTAVGSERQRVDPITSMFNRLDNHYKQISDNTLTDAIIRDGNFEGDFKPVLTADVIRERKSLLTSLAQTKKDIGSLVRTAKKENRADDIISKKINELSKELDDSINYAEQKMSLALSDAGEIMLLSKGEFDKLSSEIDSIRTKLDNLSLKKSSQANIVSELKNRISELSAVNKANYEKLTKELTTTSGLSPLKLKELGLAPINRWVDGIKETWLVPEDIATTVKSLDKQTTSRIIKVASRINNFSKRMITGLNLPFGVNNKTKDVQTAFITADAFIKQAQEALNISPETMKKINIGDDLVSLYGSSGGYGSSVFDDGRRTASKVLKDMQKSGFAKFIDITNPAKAIERINRTMEQSTRLSVFKKALESGLPAQEAVMVARDATVDFTKMGTVMKELNQVIPFLNARVQGVSNMVRTAKNDPMGFSRKLYYTSVVPSVLIDRWNSQFKSSTNINPNITKNYWAIVTGENEAVDRDGRTVLVPDIAVLGKKGEFQQLATIGIDEFLRRLRGEDPKKWDELAFDMLGSISPIAAGGYNPQSWWTAPLAAAGPAGKIMVGLGTNVDPYTGLDIVPRDKKGKGEPRQQYGDSTKQILKDLGETINVSPAKMQYVIGSFGQVPMQMLSATDVAAGLSKEEGIRNYSINKTAFGSAASLPWLDTFLRSGQYIGSTEYQNEMKKKQDITRKAESVSMDNKAVSDRFVDNSMRIKDLSERKKWLEDNMGSLSPEQLSMAKTEYKSRKAEGVLKPGDSPEVVANYLYLETLKMRESGVSNEEIRDYLVNLKDKGIITKDSTKMIKGLNQYGKFIDSIDAEKDDFARVELIGNALRTMQDTGIDKKYISIFLTKLLNDGLITQETKPLVVEKVKSIIKKENPK